ncbi:MAG TPA: phosphodiester glycosidase family protein [Verrucomicrobiae bacterium]|nr:phosphodiester glycosidase family protein [Verrucomicrobiae bacterium]
MHLQVASQNFFQRTLKRVCWAASILALSHAALSLSSAATVLQAWTPIFKGVDYAVGTNTPGPGGFPELQVAYLVRVDLTDPDIRLLASPRRTNWMANSTETYGYTMTNFLKTYGLQVAINANQFSPSSYFQAEGIACNMNGMVFSQGQMVSPAVTSGVNDAATLCFTSNNVATYYPTNVPPAPTNGVYTAVSGYYSILYNGVNVGSNYIGNPDFAHQLQPRTAIGLSQDRRYLFLLVIDGRQGSLDYSVGAYDWQTAEWLKLAGASDGSNMDGGGSSCLVMRDTTGFPITLNQDSASLTSPGFRQRTGGAHFGVYASPLPGFFNDVTVRPDDTSATITWTTITPATTQLRYGLDTNMTLLTSSNSTLVTNHSVLLTNLTPKTGYYFNALASVGPAEYVSSNYYFVTTNYVQTTELLAFTDEWKYTTANMDGSNWKARDYVDSGWEGTGAGLLWVDINGPNGQIPAPLNTQLPEDFNSGFPYMTYYFRKHFTFTNQVSGAELQFVGYVDDGAAFYLNGTEIYRVRMPAAPTVINNGTGATANPCSGDATCADAFSLSGPLVTTNLLVGDNVLAVEVHNRSSGSPDVTFGLAATATTPYVARPLLSLTYGDNSVTLSWDRGGFMLQEADTPTGPWFDVPGPVVNSPFTTNAVGATRFFRLAK